MTRARRAAKMLGGGMRQAGLIAAPAIVALKDPYGPLRRDHALARKLAAGLAAIDASLVEVECVQTNIVNCFVDRFADDASAINRALRNAASSPTASARRSASSRTTQVDEAAVEAATRAFAEVIR